MNNKPLLNSCEKRILVKSSGSFLYSPKMIGLAIIWIELKGGERE
jgi:hypothetical protein